LRVVRERWKNKERIMKRGRLADEVKLKYKSTTKVHANICMVSRTNPPSIKQIPENFLGRTSTP
jgi:hypothetical protein